MGGSASLARRLVKPTQPRCSSHVAGIALRRPLPNSGVLNAASRLYADIEFSPRVCNSTEVGRDDRPRRRTPKDREVRSKTGPSACLTRETPVVFTAVMANANHCSRLYPARVKLFQARDQSRGASGGPPLRDGPRTRHESRVTKVAPVSRHVGAQDVADQGQASRSFIACGAPPGRLPLVRSEANSPT
jgi:hypothetical protein